MLYFSQCYAAASVVQVSLEPVQHQQAPLCVYMLMYPVRQHVRVFVRDNQQASVFCIFPHCLVSHQAHQTVAPSCYFSEHKWNACKYHSHWQDFSLALLCETVLNTAAIQFVLFFFLLCSPWENLYLDLGALGINVSLEVYGWCVSRDE